MNREKKEKERIEILFRRDSNRKTRENPFY